MIAGSWLLAPGCDVGEGAPSKTPRMTSSDALEVLKMHRVDRHPPAEAQAAQGGQVREVRPQAEQVKKPTLTLNGQSTDQEEYNHFLYLFEQYKERLGNIADNPARLVECLLPDVSKMLYSILGLFINGVKDMELQQDPLAEQNMTLPKTVTQAVACETAKRSQGILDNSQQVVTSISTYKKYPNKVIVPPDCCGNCGNKRHSDRKDCPAKDNVCSCGIKGHLRKYCYRDGKKRNPQSGGKEDHQEGRGRLQGGD
jgi:hypothetical protein